MKRIFDLTITILFLLIFGWFLAILILFSAFTHRSSGLYKQVRIGRNQKEFIIFKVQSMKSIPGFDGSVTLKNDPRVTAYGNLIRKFKLDELPQILNVFNGSMSIVGPRPTVKEDAERMDKRQCKRFNVRPGLTGLAQINGNTSISWPKRIEFDLQYIDNQSFIFDLKIILKTIRLILTDNAETHPEYDNEWED